ncbi:MAG: insulinase family protein [Immundisolibacter sp.]|uniref:M16 family metallopeptidase n=1 Tax=Immundisolibacter sp. TaxID=1934948 RepID=UPI001982EF49|nr:insulinase family protein [Immundisolibacter sp.]MBC7161976.1 insulinase family protein [Immundisolibacter sp.]
MPHPAATTTQALPNGGRITFDPRPQAASVAVVLRLAGGTREETAADAGHLHLLEHLLLRRTARSDSSALARRITALGGMVNAETGREHLALIGRAPAGQASALAELLVECLCEPAFDETDLALELGVIEAERTFVGQTPPHEALIRLAWPQHPLGRLVLPADPASAGPAALQRLWARQCVGARLGVAVVGAFDVAAVEAALAPLARLPAGTAPDWGAPPEFVPGRYGDLRDERPASLLWALPCMPYDRAATAGWELTAAVLEFTLAAALRDSGLAYACAVWPEFHSDAGLIAVQVSTVPGRVAACADAVNACLDALANEGSSSEMTNLARDALSARAALARDDLENQAQALTQHPPGIEPAPGQRIVLPAAGCVLQIVV